MKNTSAALPDGWSEATLGDLLIRIVGGGTPPRNVTAYFEGTIPWFTVKDMKSPHPGDAQEHISNEAIRCSATNLIEPGTLVIATRIALGKAIMPTVRCTINQDLKALYFGSDVSPKFMRYWVMASEQLIQSRGSGTTVMGIRLEHVKEFSVAVPPANEQIRIVEKLEELLSDLDAGVAELKAAQRKLAQYRQSLLKAAVEGTLTADWRAARASSNEPQESGADLLQRILTERRTRWETKQLAKFSEQGKTPLKDWQAKYPEPVAPDTTGLSLLPEGWAWASTEQLCDFITKGTTPPKGMDSGKDKSIPFLRVTNLTDKGELDFTDRVFVSTTVHNGFLARSVVYPNDVLMNIVGPPLGQVSIVPDDYDEWNINQAIAIFRAIPGVLPRFIAACLLSATTRTWFKARAKTTAGQTNLTLELCRELPTPLPPVKEQVEIIAILEAALSAAKEQEAAIVRGLQQSAAQRKNILKAAFAGQLVPQDPNDEPASMLLERIRAARDNQERPSARAHRKPPKRSVEQNA